MLTDLRSVPKDLVESATKITNYLLCPQLQQEGQSDAMIAGTIRHWCIEQYIKGGDWPDFRRAPQWTDVPDLHADILDSIKRAIGHIPHSSGILSVEGSSLPTRYRYEAYGKTFAMVEIAPGYWLRGAADVVADGGDYLEAIDWKGREKVDNEIQALCYALTYSAIFPGFRGFRIKFVYLGTGEIEVLSYSTDDVEALRGHLVAIIDRKRGDTERKPTQCIRCPSCVHFATCPEGQAKAVEPLLPVPVAAKAVQIKDAVAQYRLPATVPERIDMLRRVKVAASVADALKDRLDDAVKVDLKGGPIIIDGREYRLAEIGGQYYVSDEPGACKLAEDIGLDVTPMRKIDKGLLMAAVDAELAKRKAAGEDVTELTMRYDAVVRQSTSKQIKDRAAK